VGNAEKAAAVSGSPRARPTVPVLVIMGVGLLVAGVLAIAPPGPPDPPPRPEGFRLQDFAPHKDEYENPDRGSTMYRALVISERGEVTRREWRARHDDEWNDFVEIYADARAPARVLADAGRQIGGSLLIHGARVTSPIQCRYASEPASISTATASGTSYGWTSTSLSMAGPTSSSVVFIIMTVSSASSSAPFHQ